MTESGITSVFVSNLNEGGIDLGPHRLESRGGVWTEKEVAETPLRGDLLFESDMLLPGFVDFHGHFGLGPYAIDIDLLPTLGVTTLCSQGDAGISNFDAWRKNSKCRTVRSLMALNIGPEGERLSDCLGDVTSDFEKRICDLAHENRDVIRLISVNLSERSLGSADPERMLNIALNSATQSGLPLMLALAPHHVLPIEVQLSSLRSGDVITYCFRSKPWCLFPTNDPLYAVQAAIERGVLLDVGHGSEAFDGDTAQRAIKSGVLPHIVSSGIKREESGQPKPLLLARVMQRLAAMGMSMSSLIRAVTITPASVLGLTDGSGTFRLGGRADMTALNTAHSHWAANAVMANGFPVISSGPKIGIR